MYKIGHHWGRRLQKNFKNEPEIKIRPKPG